MADPLLRLENIHKKYGNSNVLSGVSLELHRGDVGVIVGPSGAGKSTLLRCVNLLTRPDTGMVWFAGRDLTAASEAEVSRARQEIGMVFQDFNLFNHLRAVDNVAMPLQVVKKTGRQAARGRAVQELARVGLQDKAGSYPAQLSGGQKQRVAIARALAMDPKLMLFDEPTSALDPELIGEVLEVMKKLAREGMTMLVVSHEMGFAREVATKIVFIEGGVVVEEGPPGEMFANPKNERTGQFLGKIAQMHSGDGARGLSS